MPAILKYFPEQISIKIFYRYNKPITSIVTFRLRHNTLSFIICSITDYIYGVNEEKPQIVCNFINKYLILYSKLFYISVLTTHTHNAIFLSVMHIHTSLINCVLSVPELGCLHMLYEYWQKGVVLLNDLTEDKCVWKWEGNSLGGRKRAVVC